MKNRKATVKTLIEILAEIKNVPTTADGSMDMDGFHNLPEVKAVVTLIKFLKAEELIHKFPVASLLFAGRLK